VRIEVNYLAEEQDLADLQHALRFAREMATTSAMAGLYTRQIAPSVVNGKLKVHGVEGQSSRLVTEDVVIARTLVTTIMKLHTGAAMRHRDTIRHQRIGRTS
jgi:hypothetical protein